MGAKKYIGGTTTKTLKQDLSLINALYGFIIISLFLFLIASTSGPFEGMLDYLPSYSLTIILSLLAILTIAGVINSGMLSRNIMGTLEEFNQKIDAILQVTQKMRNEDNLDAILNMTVKFAILLTRSNACHIMLGDGDKLVLKAATGGRIDKLIDFKVPVTKGMGGMAIEVGKPLIMDDNNKLDIEPTLKGVVRYRVQNMLCIPLINKGRTVGIIEILNTRRKIFDEIDIKLISYLADQIAIPASAAGFYAEAANAGIEYATLDDTNG